MACNRQSTVFEVDNQAPLAGRRPRLLVPQVVIAQDWAMSQTKPSGPQHPDLDPKLRRLLAIRDLAAFSIVSGLMFIADYP